MQVHQAGEIGRILIVNLKRDEKLLESISEAVRKAQIRDAIVLSAIGSLQRAHFHRVTSLASAPVDEHVVLERPLELASLQGVIVDYEPHLHMVISDSKAAYTGHLEPDTAVVYLAEIAIAEIRGVRLKRQKDENNIAMLVPRRND